MNKGVMLGRGLTTFADALGEPYGAIREHLRRAYGLIDYPEPTDEDDRLPEIAAAMAHTAVLLRHEARERDLVPLYWVVADWVETLRLAVAYDRDCHVDAETMPLSFGLACGAASALADSFTRFERAQRHS